MGEWANKTVDGAATGGWTSGDGLLPSSDHTHLQSSEHPPAGRHGCLQSRCRQKQRPSARGCDSPQGLRQMCRLRWRRQGQRRRRRAGLARCQLPPLLQRPLWLRHLACPWTLQHRPLRNQEPTACGRQGRGQKNRLLKTLCTPPQKRATQRDCADFTTHLGSDLYTPAAGAARRAVASPEVANIVRGYSSATSELLTKSGMVRSGHRQWAKESLFFGSLARCQHGAAVVPPVVVTRGWLQVKHAIPTLLSLYLAQLSMNSLRGQRTP